MAKLERDYQRKLIEKIESLFPGCVILKNDANYLQGIPDLVILYKKYWACLEVKRTASEPQRPNQVYYVDYLNSMSFSAFIFPENEEDVLHDLQLAFRTRRNARVPERK